ncbi:MAG: tetraacyldisaccharide 4'-kinase [Pseudomonadota bacterium]
MRAPRFWAEPAGVLATLLSPLSLLWRLGAAIRKASIRPVSVGVPVICIGNVTAGGAGKTPLALAWLSRMSSDGRNVHVVSRGYGGRVTGPHRVDPSADRAEDVGDEPLLLASFAPVWVARDRAAGATAAVAAGAELILMDDGFQNPGLVKDASILVVDAGQGVGNGRIVPAGPLREPVAEALARADAVVLVGDAQSRAKAQASLPWLADAIPARVEPLRTGLDLAGQRVVAFAGLGRPQKFFDTLRQAGAILCRAEAFPDHHIYTPKVLDRLIRTARAEQALLITTEKDAVRISPAYRNELMVLPVQMVVEDWTALEAIVNRLVAKSP